MFANSQADADNLQNARQQLNVFIQSVFSSIDSNVEPRKVIPILVEIY